MLKKILLMLPILSVVLLSSCEIPFISWPKVLIDNPTDKELIIKLDNKEYKIPALENITLSIKSWEHNLSLLSKSNKQENIKNFIVQENISNKIHLLNPVETDYIIWKTYYSLNKEPIPDNLLSKIKINWIKYEWFFEKINWIFIENTWDYDLKTQEPDDIEVEWKESIIKSKIWRTKDFKAEYFSRYPNEKPE